MKVLTKNIKLFFECVTDDDKRCPTPQKQESDPAELALSGPPVCPVCQEEMAIDEWCLMTN